jgi:hypothetical protein
MDLGSHELGLIASSHAAIGGHECYFQDVYLNSITNQTERFQGASTPRLHSFSSVIRAFDLK